MTKVMRPKESSLMFNFLPCQLLGDSTHSRWEATWHEVTVACESVIEKIMVEGLREEALNRNLDLRPTWSDSPIDSLLDGMLPTSIWLSPQRSVGNFRADFMLIGKDSNFDRIELVVECDGRQWHASNWEQIARDRQRAAEMRGRGLLIRRFTGSQIRRDPTLCAKSIFDNIWPHCRRAVPEEEAS